MRMVLLTRTEFETDMPHASPSAIINYIFRKMLDDEKFSTGGWRAGAVEKWDGRIWTQNPLQGSASEQVQACFSAEYILL